MIPVSMARELAAAGLTAAGLTDQIGPEAVARLAAAYGEDERRAAIEADPQLMLIAARWTATVLGWPVFPLRPRSKEPLPRTRGFYDATTDLDKVEWWWRRCPQANIGVPTGITFDVIDVDGPEGYASLRQAQQAGSIPPPIASVFTGGGMHLYLPADRRRRNRARIAPGIDTRATGGYVVIPPSLHPNGLRYRWHQLPSRPAFHTSQQQGGQVA